MYNGYVVLFKVRLVRELEKKFSGKHVVVVAQRRILPKPTRKTRSQKQMRPRRYTLYEFFRLLKRKSIKSSLILKEILPFFC